MESQEQLVGLNCPRHRWDHDKERMANLTAKPTGLLLSFPLLLVLTNSKSISKREKSTWKIFYYVLWIHLQKSTWSYKDSSIFSPIKPLGRNVLLLPLVQNLLTSANLSASFKPALHPNCYWLKMKKVQPFYTLTASKMKLHKPRTIKSSVQHTKNSVFGMDVQMVLMQ